MTANRNIALGDNASRCLQHINIRAADVDS